MFELSSCTAPELQEGTRKLVRKVSRRDKDGRQDTCLPSLAILSEIFFKDIFAIVD